MSETTENTIEVQEIEEKVEKTFNTDGLLPEEVKLAEEHGLITEEKEEDGEHKEQSESETTEVARTEEEKEEVEDKKPSFEEVEQNESLSEKYNPNEKALYWKWKNDKRKRQALQKELDDIKSSSELQTVKELAAAKKIQRISSVLNSDDLTVEKIQSIINGQEVTVDDEPITKSDLERLEQERELENSKRIKEQQEFNERLLTIEKIGLAKYEDFNDIVKLADEVAANDNTCKEILSSAFQDTETDEEKILDRIVTIAKLNPNWGKKDDSGATESASKDVDRVVKNSKKKISSAAITGGGSSSIVTEDTLTVEQAGRLSNSQWSKLSEKTKKRILMGIDP
jgi:hypothetical protein